jgi:phosphoserine aminotransferase
MYTPFSRDLSSSNFIALTGVRVSLYNAVTEANADTLIQFMEKFVSEAGSQASA